MKIVSKKIDAVRDKLFEPLPCLPSGFSHLDNLVGGCPLGQVIIVGGRASLGKSSLCIDLALNAASYDSPVLFLTVEMSAVTVFRRMLSSVGLVPLKHFGKTDETENGRLADAEGIIGEYKILVDDDTDLTPSKIIQKVDEFSTQVDRPFLTVVDYLDLIQPDTRTQSRAYELEEIMKVLQREIKQRNTCLVVASQLNREVEKRENPWPRLSDLRSSGAIEQSADMVWLLFREDYYKLADGDIAQELTGEAKLIVAKNRHGPVGVVDLAFIPEICSFRNVEGESLKLWNVGSPPPF